MSFVRQARGRRHSALACAAKCSGTSRRPRVARLGPWPSRPTAWAGSWPHVAQGRTLLSAEREEFLYLALAARRPCVMLRAQTGVPAKRARPARIACGQAACKANLGRPPRRRRVACGRLPMQGEGGPGHASSARRPAWAQFSCLRSTAALGDGVRHLRGWRQSTHVRPSRCVDRRIVATTHASLHSTGGDVWV